jgi:DNA-directed RNA polymerase specialized sigma24 family protein
LLHPAEFENVSFPKTSSRKEWVLTQDAFDRFLALLDRDREKAGQRYEDIRYKLLKYFQWCGSPIPDIDADETINRVMRRIEEGGNLYNLDGFIHGVAKLVHKESQKRRYLKQDVDEAELIELTSPADRSAMVQHQDCLERCLSYLSAEDREVITEYYKYEKVEKIECRKRLAARLGVTLNALRVKMHRQRLNLEACVDECLSDSTE